MSDADRATRAVYEQHARAWQDRRQPGDEHQAVAFADRARAQASAHGLTGPIIDLGCGPGWFTAAMGPGAVALDAARAMLDLVPAHAPDARRVQADLAHLPVRRHALAGAWASKSLVHVARPAMPLALHDLHRALAVGAALELVVFEGDLDHGTFPDDDFPGRSFSAWPRDLLGAVITGAGFTIDCHEVVPRGGVGHHVVQATRARTLADTVGPGMRLLVCGLNPSLYAADAGVGFARPGNRFWPAALDAGIVGRDRDPVHALVHHGIGMTDLVKRATARADELANAEFRAGRDRLEHLVAWLKPQAVCVVGLSGWRAAVSRRAVAGEQPDDAVGGRPVYVMPNTSGINAGSSRATLADHLRAAAALADRS